MNDKLEYYVLPFISTILLWIIVLTVMLSLEIMGLIQQGIVYNVLLLLSIAIILNTKLRIIKYILANKNNNRYLFGSIIFIIVLIVVLPLVHNYPTVDSIVKLAILLEILAFVCYPIYDRVKVFKNNFKLVDYQSEIYFLDHPGSNEYIPLESHLAIFFSMLLIFMSSMLLEISFWTYINVVVKLVLIVAILASSYIMVRTIKKWDAEHIATVTDLDYVLMALAYTVGSLTLFVSSSHIVKIENIILLVIIILSIYIIIYIMLRYFLKKNLPVIDKYKNISKAIENNNILINPEESEIEQTYKKMRKRNIKPTSKLFVAYSGAIEELKNSILKGKKLLIVNDTSNEDIISQLFYSTCSASDPINVYINLVNLLYEKKLWKQIFAYLAAIIVVINIIRQTLGYKSITTSMYVFILITILIIIVWLLPYLLIGESDGTTKYKDIYIRHIIIVSSSNNPIVIGITGKIVDDKYLDIKKLIENMNKGGNNVLCIVEQEVQPKELRVSRTSEQKSETSGTEVSNYDIFKASFDDLGHYRHGKTHLIFLAKKYGILIEPNEIEMDRVNVYVNFLHKEWQKIKYNINIYWITIDSYPQVMSAFGNSANIDEIYFEELCLEYYESIKSDTKNYGFSTFLKNKVKGQAIGDIIG